MREQLSPPRGMELQVSLVLPHLQSLLRPLEGVRHNVQSVSLRRQRGSAAAL